MINLTDNKCPIARNAYRGLQMHTRPAKGVSNDALLPSSALPVLDTDGRLSNWLRLLFFEGNKEVKMKA